VRKRKSLYRGPSRFGSTIQFAVRAAKYDLRKQGVSFAKSARGQALFKGRGDYRVKRLYRQCAEFNYWNPSNDPAEIDHIRPIAQGGEHVFENLRAIRRSVNQRDGAHRSEELIATLLKLNEFYKGDWL